MISKNDDNINNEITLLDKDEYINYIAAKLTLEYYHTENAKDRINFAKLIRRIKAIKEFIQTGTTNNTD